jgi:hypothetical protein
VFIHPGISSSLPVLEFMLSIPKSSFWFYSLIVYSTSLATFQSFYMTYFFSPKVRRIFFLPQMFWNFIFTWLERNLFSFFAGCWLWLGHHVFFNFFLFIFSWFWLTISLFSLSKIMFYCGFKSKSSLFFLFNSILLLL